MKIVVLFFLSVAVLSGCVVNKSDTSHSIIELNRSDAAMRMSIDVAVGKNWSSRMQAGPFVFNVLPQMAVWIEDRDGRLVETLYITGADFQKLRHAAKNADSEKFYRECLPLWASRLEAAGKDLPSKTNPYPDSLTSATPAADFSLRTAAVDIPDAALIILELNKSGDNNEFYTEENNDWAGQPSLIYSAALSSGIEGTIELHLVGHGGLLSDSPGIYPAMASIDTALGQIESIKVVLE